MPLESTDRIKFFWKRISDESDQSRSAGGSVRSRVRWPSDGRPIAIRRIPTSVRSRAMANPIGAALQAGPSDLVFVAELGVVDPSNRVADVLEWHNTDVITCGLRVVAGSLGLRYAARGRRPGCGGTTPVLGETWCRFFPATDRDAVGYCRNATGAALQASREHMRVFERSAIVRLTRPRAGALWTLLLDPGEVPRSLRRQRGSARR